MTFDKFAKDWEATDPMSIQDWLLIGRDRVLPDLLPMPAGQHINLGQGKRPIGDARPLDREHGWSAEHDPLLMPAGSVAGIWAHAFFDYISQDRLLGLLSDCHHVLKPGGVMNIVGPHGNSDLWNEDALRKTRFTEDTWRNLFSSPWYDPQAGMACTFQFEVHACFILGVNWRNLSLFTQLVKHA